MSFKLDIDAYNQRSLLLFPLCLRQNIEELCLNGQLGLLNITIMDISIMSSGILPPDSEDEPPIEANHHLNIRVPYGGKKLSWDIIFDPEDMYQVPDFDFNDDDFLNYTNLETLIERVPSLVNWDLRNPKTLTSVLSEFLRLYKESNLDRLQNDIFYSRFANEYAALTDLISADNIEVITEANLVQFLIFVGMDMSVIDSLPRYCQDIIYSNDNTLVNAAQEYIHLRIQYIKVEGSRTNSVLHLSPRLDQIFSKFRFKSLPELTRDGSLAQYVVAITEAIEEKLVQVANYCKLRKQLILYLAAANATTILEFDDSRFSYCAFTVTDDNDYSCLVQVLLNDDFPLQKPKVIVQSIGCQESKKCYEVLHNFKYSPDWAVSAIVTSFMEKLPEVVEKLKAHKH